MKKVEYRYYEMPQGLPALALLGERWEIIYGTDEMHFHNYLEIGYCHYGNGTIRFGDNKEIPYEAGTLTFIPKNIPHHTCPAPDEMEKLQKWEYLFLDTEKIIEQFFGSSPRKRAELEKDLNKQPIVLGNTQNAKAVELLNMIFEEIIEKREHYKYAVDTLALNFLLFFARLEKEDNQQIEENQTSMKYIRDIVNYMETHYMDPIESKDLADCCGLSESHMRRLFLEYMNETPMEYLKLVRIDKSCELLAKSEETIELIAAKVGYPAVSSYMRNFKKITGTSPSQWRKNARENPENIRNYHVSVLKGW